MRSRSHPGCAERRPRTTAQCILLYCHETEKKLHLALQGGGAHGAFTWGVIDRLLDDENIEIDGVSGASAGAVNAVLLIDGLARGGPREAEKRLADFWRAASRDGDLPDASARCSIACSGSCRWRARLPGLVRGVGPVFSPYELNPLNINR